LFEPYWLKKLSLLHKYTIINRVYLIKIINMRKIIQILIFLVPLLITWELGYKTGQQDFLNIQTERVNNLYGEGDLGCEINYYLQTGDTSLENY